MRVILTAFGGKLKSEEMDWPDDSRQEISMALLVPIDISSFRIENPPVKSMVKRGVFFMTGKTYDTEFGPPIYEYSLKDLE